MSKNPSPIVETELVALLQRIAAGDESALSVFYEQTIGHTYGLILRILKSPEQTEEVVDDVYFQVWSQAAHFDPSRSEGLVWLLMLCRSRAVDALRRNKATRQHELCQEASSLEEAGQFDEVPDLLAAVEEGCAVHQALKALAVEQQQLLALAFFRGYSHEQLARVSDLPLGTVKSKIRRALQALREPLAQLKSPRKEG